MSYRVVFSPEAEEQLAALYGYIAAAASPDIAARYTEAIVSYCESLRTFPHRGTTSTLTKTDPFSLTEIDPPLARANTQVFASERGQGRAAVFAARRSVPLTPCRGEYAREWLCARHFRAHSHDD
jgi:plasmid stabilization system protein ParE